MFYFLTSKFIKSNAENSYRNIIIIGSICYIILHAYLFSANSNETTENYRHYIYYLLFIDAALTGAFIWLFGGNPEPIDTNTNTDTETEISISGEVAEMSRDTSDQNKPSHRLSLKFDSSEKQKNSNVSCLDDRHQELLEKAIDELKLKDDSLPGSPFVKKNDNRIDNISNVSEISNIPLYMPKLTSDTYIPLYK